MAGNVKASAGNKAAEGNPSKNAKTCSFYLAGCCVHGDSCNFSHDTEIPASVARTPTIIQTLPGLSVFSIDVECVATDVHHNARSIAQVALVDEWGNPLLNILIKQDQPVKSYLTALTGITEEMLQNFGVPLAEAMSILRSFLTPDSILVGQSILKDVHWLQLIRGVDYHSLIDLYSVFRVWDPKYNSFTNFSQDHCAKVWLGITERSQHNAVTDAIISMSLFNAYRSVNCTAVYVNSSRIVPWYTTRLIVLFV